MADRVSGAKKIIDKGYNCAQSVLMAFSEDFGLGAETAARISCGLGGGIARSRETCGAVLGGVMVLGLAKSSGGAEDKKELYRISRAFMDDFRSEAGSVICRELLGLKEGQNNGTAPEKRTPGYYKKRPCAELVGLAAELLEKYLESDE